MKYITRAFLLLIGSLSLVSFFIFSRKGAATDNSYLIMGTASGYAPFVSINEHGEYEGFDIDVAHALAQKLGKTVVIKDLGSMAPLFIALEQGSIDGIIWGLSITDNRLKKVAMIPYHGEIVTSYPLLFWEKIPTEITTFEDMKNKTICVEPASSQEVFLDKFPTINKLSTEKVDDALLNLQYRKADAALVEPAIAKKFKNKYPQVQILEVPLGGEDQVYGVGIAVKPTNTSLIDALTKAVDELRQEEVIKKCEEKWGLA